jgi:hypothetical protein
MNSDPRDGQSRSIRNLTVQDLRVQNSVHFSGVSLNSFLVQQLFHRVSILEKESKQKQTEIEDLRARVKALEDTFAVLNEFKDYILAGVQHIGPS